MTKVGVRRVAITGGGSGIGRAVARRILERGGKVAIVGRRERPLRALAEEFPGKVVTISANLADAKDRDGVIKNARQGLNGLDGFVHCAGVVYHQNPGAIREQELREQLEVNLVAPLRLGEQALALLDSNGAIVMVTSTLARRPVATSAVYSAAKAGLSQVVRVLAMAGAERGIRVNGVAPGLVDTNMINSRKANADSLATLRDLHLLKRLGTADEVADSIMYMLTSPWMTGSELTIDGGLSIK